MASLTIGNNQAPFGWLDIPPESSTVRSGPMEIGGWALDDRSLSFVEIYLDGKKTGNALYGFYRPDVAAVFPGYPGNPNSGFTAAIDAAPLVPGIHQLMIRIVDDQGLSTEMPPRFFIKQ